VAARETTLVRVAKPALGLRALAAKDIVATVEGDTLHAVTPAQGAQEIVRALAARNLFPSEVRPEGATLEDVFLRLTSDTAGEDDA